MKPFSVLLLLLAALTAVIAIPNLHAFGLLACGDDAACLDGVYGRALMAPSPSINEMTTISSALISSSSKLATVTVDSYTTVPCSTESTEVGVSTTMVSKHTTSTDLITITVTTSSSVSSASSNSVSVPTLASTTGSTSTIISSSSTISSSTIPSTSGIANTSSTGTVSISVSSTTAASSLSTATTSNSSSFVGGVASTSSASTMAYIPPSYGIASTTGIQTQSGIAMFSSTSSIDALSATQSQFTPTLSQPLIPIALTSASALSHETLTTSSTSTHTTTIMVSSFNAHTAIIASASTVDTSTCNAFSTVYITVTGTMPSSTPAATCSGTNTYVPVNPLDSQSPPRSTLASSSGAASAVGIPQHTASTDALSAPVSAPHTTDTVMTITSSLLVMPATASNSSSITHPSSSTPSTSPFANGGGGGNTSSGTTPAARGNKHTKGALVMCVVAALVMFAV